jgi:hypothetical protein
VSEEMNEQTQQPEETAAEQPQATEDTCCEECCCGKVEGEAARVIQAAGDLTVVNSAAASMVAQQDATVSQSAALAIVAGRDVSVTAGSTCLSIVGGDAKIEKAFVGALITNSAHVQNGAVGIALGQVTVAEGGSVLLSGREAAIFGAALGIVSGIVAGLLGGCRSHRRRG